MLENVLGLFVGKGNQGRGKKSGDSEDDSILDVSWVQLIDSPIQPNGQCRYDESISVEKRGGFGGQSSAEILKQQLFFVRQVRRLLRHGRMTVGDGTGGLLMTVMSDGTTVFDC